MLGRRFFVIHLRVRLLDVGYILFCVPQSAIVVLQERAGPMVNPLEPRSQNRPGTLTTNYGHCGRYCSDQYDQSRYSNARGWSDWPPDDDDGG